MYNEERKQKFIEYAENRGIATNYHFFFSNSEKYEIEKGKDLCEMETIDLLSFLVTFKSARTATMQRTLLSRYIDWCVILGYSKFNWISIKVVSNDSLIKVYNSRTQMFYLSEEKYEIYKKKIVNACEHGGEYLKGIFMAFYEGFDYAHLAKMRISDINFEEKTITIDGNIYNVSSELVETLVQASKITSLQVIGSNNMMFTNSLYPDSIWKAKSEELTLATITRSIRVRYEQIKKILNEPEMSKANLNNSGFFNTIYRMMKKDGINLEDIDTENISQEQEDMCKKYFDNPDITNNANYVKQYKLKNFMRVYGSYVKELKLKKE